MKKTLLITTFLALAFFIKGQNTGPVAPEAMSFEPIDAMDMVNLLTGDFTYVLPLINIPGPEGGYPVALSYHAGVTVDQEASWVGLGWTVTPGAINRNVNGYADDLKNGLVKQYVGRNNIANVREGSMQLSVNLGNRAISSVGVQFGWGANRGFGGSVSFGPEESPLSFKTGVGISNGSVRAYASVNAKFETGISSGISVSTDGNIAVGIDYRSIEMAGMDFSLASGGGGIGLTVAGQKISLGNNSSGYGQTRGEYLSGWMVSLPTIWGSLNIRNSKVRLFYNSIEEKWVNGTLNLEEAYHQADNYDNTGGYSEDHHSGKVGMQDINYAMDVQQDLYKFYEVNDNHTWEQASNKYNGLLFPSYDSYNVSSQGMSGSITPQLYYNGLLFDDSKEIKYFFDNSEKGNDYDLINEEVRYWNSTTQKYLEGKEAFYFNSDVSAYFDMLNGAYYKNTSNGISFQYGTTENEIDGISTWNISEKKKITGRVVNWYTNEELRNNVGKAAGFIEDVNIYDERRQMVDGNYINGKIDPNGIGGFMITAMDGKTYHYSIPVYQFAEYLINKGGLHPDDISLVVNENMYAYSWLLTSITGPDFIDKNGNGVADEGDYGYWVNFNYGKWSDTYFWQMPFVEETDKPYRNGIKQVYYLDYIETKTHAAYFVKSQRQDGLSKTCSNSYSIPLWRDKVDEEQSLCGYSHCEYDNKVINCGDNFFPADQITKIEQNLHFHFNIEKQTRPLKLDKVVLVKKPFSIHKENGESGKNIGGINYEDKIRVKGTYIQYKLCAAIDECYSPLEVCNTSENILNGFLTENFDKVIDNSDISTDLNEEILKSVTFNYDYSLCKQTPNSIANGGGKLALNSVQIAGKKGAVLTPPYQFKYNIKGNNSFDLDNKDDWGFDRTNPENWSLREIITPIGTSILIDYESDEYSKETALNECNYYIEKEKTTIVTPDPTTDIEFTLTIPDYIDMHEVFDNAIDGGYQVAGTFETKRTVNYKKLSGDWAVNYDKYPERKEYFNFLKNIVTPVIDFNNRTVKCTFPFNPDIYTTSNDGDDIWIDFDFLSVKDVCLKVNTSNNVKGGGLRVSELTLTNGLTSNKQKFIYDLPSGKISGVTSYAPGSTKGFYIPYQNHQPSPMVMYNHVTVEQRNEDNKVLLKEKYEFKVPGSTTGYKEENYNEGDILTVSNDADDHYSSASVKLHETTGDHTTRYYGRSSTVYDFTSSIGRLEKKEYFNALDERITEETYEYYTPGELSIGISSEAFQSCKSYISWHGNGHLSSTTEMHYTSSRKKRYPNILKAIKSRSSNNTSTVSYSDFDLITGGAQTVINENPDGSVNKSVSIPAYTISSYSQMGSKVDNIYNKNMLTQQAATLNYEKQTDGSWAPFSASIQTWKGDWNNYVAWNTSGDATYIGEDKLNDGTDVNIWRKHKSFIWKSPLDGNGYYTNFTNYDTPDELKVNFPGWANENYTGTSGTDDGWKRTSEVVRYDHWSSPVEVKDINGDFAASKKGPDNVYTTVSAANASYASFAATSFEFGKSLIPEGGNFLFEGGVVLLTDLSQLQWYKSWDETASDQTQMVSGIEAHTGEKYLVVSPTGASPKYKGEHKTGATLIRNSDYRASVWVHKNSPGTGALRAVVGSQNFTSQELVGQFGDWKLYNLDFEVKTTDTEFNVFVDATGGAIYIDDLRVAPYEAAVSSYTYDEAGQVTAIINNDNFATKYEYDDAGRLKATYTETKKGFAKLTEQEYNYANAFSIYQVNNYYGNGNDFSASNIPCTGGNLYFELINLENDPWTFNLPAWASIVSSGTDYVEINVQPNLGCSGRTTGITITNSTSNESTFVTLHQLSNSVSGVFKFSDINKSTASGAISAKINCPADNRIAVRVFCQYLAGAQFVVEGNVHQTKDETRDPVHDFGEIYYFDVKAGDVIDVSAELWGGAQSGSQNAEIAIHSIEEYCGVTLGTTQETKINADWGN